MSGCYAGIGDAAPGTSVAVDDALAQADGRARLLVKAMAVAERVGTRFYSLRQARANEKQAFSHRLIIPSTVVPRTVLLPVRTVACRVGISARAGQPSVCSATGHWRGQGSSRHGSGVDADPKRPLMMQYLGSTLHSLALDLTQNQTEV